MPKKFTLGKQDRLKRRKVIEQLFSEGRSFVVFPCRVSYSATNLIETALQTGFGASSRQFRKAVHRNRIKRLLRESWRLQKNELQAALQQRGMKMAVFIVYIGKELPNYALVNEKITVILNRLISIVHEAPAENP